MTRRDKYGYALLAVSAALASIGVNATNSPQMGLIIYCVGFAILGAAWVLLLGGRRR